MGTERGSIAISGRAETRKPQTLGRRARYAALLAFIGHRWSHRVQCHNSVVLAPLIVRSCVTLVTEPHDGHGGGGATLMVLSGIRSLHCGRRAVPVRDYRGGRNCCRAGAV